MEERGRQGLDTAHSHAPFSTFADATRHAGPCSHPVPLIFGGGGGGGGVGSDGVFCDVGGGVDSSAATAAAAAEVAAATRNCEHRWSTISTTISHSCAPTRSFPSTTGLVGLPDSNTRAFGACVSSLVWLCVGGRGFHLGLANVTMCG